MQFLGRSCGFQGDARQQSQQQQQRGAQGLEQTSVHQPIDDSFAGARQSGAPGAYAGYQRGQQGVSQPAASQQPGYGIISTGYRSNTQGYRAQQVSVACCPGC